MNTTHPEPKTVPIRGVRLEVKLALSVGLLVALFMAGFGLVLHGSLEGTIRQQIQHEAINAARTAAQADLITWTAAFHTVDEGLDLAQMQARADAGTIEEFRAYDTDPVRREQIAWNKARLGRVLGDDTRILAVEIFRWKDGHRGAVVSSVYPGLGRSFGAEFMTSKNWPAVRMGRGEAQEGLLDVGENSWHVIRGSYPVLGPGGVQEGEVAVHIHAAAIAEAAAAFSEKVAWAGGVFILVSLIIAYLMARWLTSPVRRLADDAEVVVAGDFHHHTRPHSTDEIGQLARTFEHMTRWLAQAEEEADEAEHETEGIRNELALAADVTASLFPKTMPDVPGWTLGGLHDREATPGGGTYDVLRMPDGKLGLVLTEASSGGAPGALVAAMARSTLRFAAERSSDPGAVLRDANGRLAPDLSQGLNLAVLLVVIDPATGAVSIANAGHRPLLHLHAAHGTLETVYSEGVPLGAGDPKAFDAALRVAKINVEPEDTLVMYGSEISNLPGTDGGVLGEKRLAALVKQAAQLPADELVQRVGATLRKYHGEESLGADVTLMAICRR